MNSLETISNCSDASVNTEESRSTLSALSNYRGDLLELTDLIIPPKFSSIPISNSCSTLNTGDSNPYDFINDLRQQLHAALELKEHYKTQIYNSERKSELSFRHKFETLLKEKNELKIHLEIANKQIERLINSYNSHDEKSNELYYKNKIVTLEKEIQDAYKLKSQIQNDLTLYKQKKNEYEDENISLKSELNRVKLELSAKHTITAELKEKIASQYVKIQNLLQQDISLRSSLVVLQNELKYAKKVETWFREQLHLCQIEKGKLNSEYNEEKTKSLDYNKQIEKLMLETSQLKHKWEESELNSIKDKGKLLRRYEDLECSINHLNEQETKSDSTITYPDIENIEKYYKLIAEDLNSELKTMKQSMNQLKINSNKIFQENAQLISKYLVLQKTNEQNVLAIENYEMDKKQLTMKFSLISENEQILKKELSEATNINNLLNIDIVAKNCEKEVIENSITKLREQFSILKATHDMFNQELKLKNQRLLALQTENQHLFMEKNWQNCELEKIKEKYSELKFTYEKCKVDNEKLYITMDARLAEADEKYRINMLESKSQLFEIEVDRNTIKSILHERDCSITNMEENIKLLEERIRSREMIIEDVTNDNLKLKQKIEDVNLNVEKDKNLYGHAYHDIEILDRDLKLLEHIYNFCEGANINTVMENKNEQISMLLNVITNYIQGNLSKLQQKDHTIQTMHYDNQRLKYDISVRLNDLEDHFDTVKNKCEVNNSLLLKLKDAGVDINFNRKVAHDDMVDKVKQLKALLQVKELEKNEKQKRYESNYRILLEKVKEHKNCRNQAEKHHTHIQNAYSILHNDYNFIKSAVIEKDSEINKFQKLIDEITCANDELKQTVLKLEEVIAEYEIQKKCNEYEVLMELYKQTKSDREKVEKANSRLENDVRTSRDEIDKLKTNIQELIVERDNKGALLEESTRQNKSLNGEKIVLISQLATLEQDVEAKQIYIDELKSSATRLQDICTRPRCIELLKGSTERCEYFEEEIKLINCNLHKKCEELKQLVEQKLILEDRLKQNEGTTRKILAAYRTQMKSSRNDIASTRNEKFFLQRLCNDLKVALKAQANQTKILKQQLDYFNQESTTKYPNLTSSKFDDAYINNLLQQNNAPVLVKPLCDIQLYLNLIKTDISTLQQEISQI